MPHVEIYTKFLCPYCSQAKALLKGKGIAYQEFDITMNGTRHREMLARANGRTTVPQIFINKQHIGGCDDLEDLEFKGELDPLLAA